MIAYEVRPKIVEGRKTVLEVVGPGGWVVTEYDTAKRKDAATLAEVLNHADRIARECVAAERAGSEESKP